MPRTNFTAKEESYIKDLDFKATNIWSAKCADDHQKKAKGHPVPPCDSSEFYNPDRTCLVDEKQKKPDIERKAG